MGAEGDVVGVAKVVVVELVTRGRVVESGFELVDVLGVVLSLLDYAEGVSIDHCLLQVDPLLVRSPPPSP